MAELLRQHWDARFTGMSRLDRGGCNYDAYLPDPLRGWELSMPAQVAADIADAEAAVRALNDAGTAHVSLEGTARLLLRAESVASSRIEGLAAGPRRILEAESVLAQGGDASDRVAVEILGNIAAMESAIELAVTAGHITVDDLLSVHRTLMAASPTPDLGGVVRQTQNWIGGSSHNPCAASFVPPPPEYVEPLLDDLVAYVNGDDHSPIVQAGVAHAQFETIHPFADGNGRVGRALIHVILRKRGLAPRIVPPVSLVLATWAADYIAGLAGFRYTDSADSVARSTSACAWLARLASAVSRACADAQVYSAEVDALTKSWNARLGRVRADSAVDLLIRILPGAPLLTVESGAALIGRSTVRTGAAFNRLMSAGVLRQRNVGRQRYRVFEAPDVLRLFAGLERTLASPSGDTLTDPPVRPTPARQQ